MIAFMVTEWSNKDPVGQQAAPLYDKFSDAQRAADDIFAFTGRHCRVFKLSRLYLAHQLIPA
jgi:hypothetical protein